MTDYPLAKTGGVAKIDILGPGDLADVLKLQDATRAALPEGQTQFVLPQSSVYFENLLARLTGVMIGIRSPAGNLIAQMAVNGPVELREAMSFNMISRNDLPFHHAALTDSVILFKSVSVHPSWHGNGLAKALLAYALDLPVTRSAAHVFAQNSVANKRGWGLFMQLGFGIVAAAIDPKDNQPRFVMQKPAFGFDLAPAIIADDVDASDDFAAIAQLTTRDGLIGVFDEPKGNRLAFFRQHGHINTMPTSAKIA